MIKPISTTGSFQALLTQATGIAQIQCFAARNIYDQITAEFSQDYYALIELVVESFDIAANITSLNQAPFPDTNSLDSQTEQAVKIYNNWRNYDKIGIQLLHDTGGGIFQKQGQPIILQNTPFQLPVSYIRPYLSATQEVLLVGSNDRIGCQILSNPGYKLLSGSDEILIKGQWKTKINLYKKLTQSIVNWYPIGVDLPANEPKIIRVANNKRRALYVVNAGTTNIRFFYGHQSNLLTNSCPFLTPNGSFSQESFGSFNITQQFVAMSVDGVGRLVGMEGAL